ncbi:PEPxxWA-CTERM sorting domain-containing protein [Novosphingobium chloroacetimidivorans]|nr:PEPxxWA-CTERM sorting domain-containing protein [Novosphingobium chloroacetimidivorans]
MPEASTWAMLILGFAAIGWSVRQRRGSPQDDRLHSA